MKAKQQSYYNIPTKILSVILAMFIVFSTGIISCYAEGLGVFDAIETHSIISDSVEELVDLSDVKSVDTENTQGNELYLNMKDGTTTVYTFSEPITYIDENGNLKCKSTSISELDDKDINELGFDYGNEQNNYKIYFSSNSSKGVLVEYEDFSFSMAPISDITAPGYISTGEICNEEFEDFEYADLYGYGTYLKYFPQFNGIKEEIILDEKIDSNTFSFSFKTKNCYPVLNDDGSISLFNDKNEEVQSFAAPFAYDSAYVQGMEDEHYTDECNYSLTKTQENCYTLTVTVSSDWLNAESTVYPVIIDPTTANLQSGMDLPIHSTRNTSGTDKDNTAVGKSSQYGISRTLIYMGWPGEVYGNAKINSAYYYARELTGRTSNMNINIHKVTSHWNNSYTWNNQPSYDSKILDTVNVNGNYNGGSTYWYKFDITSIVQDHLNGEDNRGFLMKYANEGGENNLRTFAQLEYATSSMRPYIVINYSKDTVAPTVKSVTKSPSTNWSADDVTITVNGAEDSESGLAEKAYSFSTDPNEFVWQSSNKFVVTSSCHVWVHIRDNAGNKNYCACIRVDIDRESPVVNSISKLEENNDSLKFEINATDTGSGVSEYSVSYNAGEYNWSNKNTFEADKNGTIYAYAKDAVGNISPSFTYEINYFDTTAPTTPAITGNPDGWTNSDVTITALSTDDKSGVAAYSFSNEKGVYNWQEENVKTFSESTTVYVYAKDNSGNISEPNTVQIKIDKTAPNGASISGNASNWTKDPVILTVNDAQDNISGLDAAAYSFSTSENTYEWQTESSKSFTSNCTVYVNIRDAAGNITYIDKIVIDKIDRSLPSVSIVKADNNGYTTITVAATDDDSGIALYSFDGGITWQEESTYTFPQNSLNVVNINVKDNVGNTTTKCYELNVPGIYEENGYIGLYSPNPLANEKLYYSINANAFMIDAYEYKEPFIFKGDSTEIYVSYANSGGFKILLKKSNPEKFKTIKGSSTIGQYKESSTDTSFNYKNVNFDFARHYNSQSGWFYSFESKLTFVDKGLIYGDMPDGTRRAFLYKSETEFYNDSANAPLQFIYGENGAVSSYEVTYNGMIYGYDANGLLAYVADSSGNQIAISRTENQIVFTDDAGRNYTVLLDDNGTIVSLTDPAGGVITYERDHSGNLIKVTDQAGVLLSEYQYNADGIMVKSSDKSITYDEAGRVVNYTYDNGAYTNFTYSQSEYEHLQSYQHKVVMKDSPYFFTNIINVETSAGASFRTEITEQYYDNSVVSQTQRSMYIYEGEEEQYHLITDIYGKTLSVYTRNADGSSESTGYEYDAGGKLIRTNNTAYFYDSNGNCSRTEEYDSENQMYYITYYVCDQNANVTKSAVLEISYEDYYNKSIPEFYDETLTYSEVMEYTYNSDGTLSKSEDVLNGNAVTYQYDSYGNVTKVASTSQTDKGAALSVTDYTYDILGNLLSAQSDSSTASYIYDAAGRQLRADADGSISRILYDEYGRVIQQIDADIYDAAKDGLPESNTYADPNAGHTYEYADNGNLISETSKYGMVTEYEYSDIGNIRIKHFDIYDYYYLADGDLDKICVGNETILDYDYNIEEDGLSIEDGDYINSISYSNGDVEFYQYNSEGALTGLYKNGEEKPVSYWTQNTNMIHKLPETYNSETGLRYLYDEENGNVNAYEHDPTNIVDYIQDNRLVSTYSYAQTDSNEETDSPAASTISGNIFETDFSIFSDGSQIINTIGELSSAYTYETDEDGVLVSDGIKIGEASILPTSYSYDENNRNINKSVALSGNNTTNLLLQYDENRVITGSGINEISSQYIYDSYDQLVRTNNSYSGYTSSYEYDNRGNMISKKLYNYSTCDLGTLTPTETTSFTYANNGWKDQLVSVNGTDLTYDENGNLLTYGDQTFSWCHGTRLKSITDGENEYSYIYDENGIRFSKTVNGETTQFAYLGGMLMAQKTGDDVLFFQYGAGGVPLGFVLNGVQYFYVTNQLGDIIGITDATGDAFVMYSYDEWGNPIQTITRDNTAEQNKIAEINPLRYRGYYYDTETGYYYLQSRYYNPEWGRFLSPDAFGYIDNSTRLGFNAYIYCANNPIMFIDPSGTKKTNNVVEVIFKTLVISIELDTLTNLFVNIVEIFNIDVNKIFNIDNDIDISVDFNAWFNSIADSTQKIFQETLLFFVTGINNFFKDIENLIAQSGLVTVIEAFIKDPFKVFEQYPNLSKLFSKLKLAPSIIDCISSISSTIDDAIEGIIDTTQSVILIAYDVIITILDVFPQTKALSKVVNVTRAFTDIFFKYVNGEYI